MNKCRLTISIDENIVKKAKKQIPNLSAFVQEMFERELSGEFHQLKINEKKKELETLESQQSQIQTYQQEQKERSDGSYKKAEEEMLERRRKNMLRRKEGI